MSRQWNPSDDGIEATAFVKSVDELGFVAVAAALRRGIGTVRRAYWRLTEHWRASGGRFDSQAGHHWPKA